MPVEGGQFFRASVGLVELYMTDPKTFTPVPSAFTRKSETESICMSCFTPCGRIVMLRSPQSGTAKVSSITACQLGMSYRCGSQKLAVARNVT